MSHVSSAYSHQDWTTVYLNKPVKKCHDGVSKRPIDPENIGNVEKPKLISDETANRIMALRLQKHMTQADVAKLVNVRVDVINRIEAKKEVHNGQLFADIIRKLERAPVKV